MWFLAFAACAGRAPDLAPIDGRLPPCPSTPNCVCSEAGADPDHAIAPLPWPPGKTPEAVAAALAALVAGEPRAALVRREGGFLHATVRTPLLRFVDDVAFRLDPEAGVVHVRSASRVGRGDLGVNRSRVEALRSRWLATVAAPAAAP